MTEICVQVFKELEEVKKYVIENGFTFLESYNNHDIYYTTYKNEELKKITYKELLDRTIIIRNIISKNLDLKNLVYKSKTLDNNGNVIKEIKTKVEIDSVEKAKSIFENSGLFCWCDYINQNYEYRKGEVVINVQYVKELGTFIEIEEFNSIKNKTDEEKFEILSNIIKSLGFPIGNDYSCKKPYMFLKKKQAN